MKKFTGKNVYITGGSSGIGLAIARLLAAEGAHLLLFSRGAARLEEARKEIGALAAGEGQRVAAMALDVGDHRAVARVMGRAVRDFGPPDILITSAGIGSADYFDNITHDAFDAVMRTNLYGTRNAVAALLGHLESRRGHVVIISSIAGYLGMFGYTAYGTSKFALTGFAECLRSELKPRGVRLTLACPPETDTPFLIEESKTIPPESRALKNMAGTLDAAFVAERIIRGVRKNRYLVIPGFLAKLVCLTQRFSPGWLSRGIADITVGRVQRGLRRAAGAP